MSRLVLYGGWIKGCDIATAEVRQHVLGLISQHWGLGSDVVVDIFAPSADPRSLEATAVFLPLTRAAAAAIVVL